MSSCRIERSIQTARYQYCSRFARLFVCAVVNRNKMSQQTNAGQIKMLIEFMEQHAELAKNSLQNSINGRGIKKKLWLRLTELLNSNGPPVKTTKGWQKVWTDYKYNAKRKLTTRMKSLTKTGGGPYDAVQISNLEERVIAAAKLNAQITEIPGVASYGAEVDMPCSSAAASSGPQRDATESSYEELCEDVSSDEEIAAAIVVQHTPGKKSCETGQTTPSAKRRCETSGTDAEQTPRAKRKRGDQNIPIIYNIIENQREFQTDIIQILKDKNEIEKKKLQLLEKQVESEIQYKKTKMEVLELKLEKTNCEIALLKRGKQ